MADLSSHLSRPHPLTESNSPHSPVLLEMSMDEVHDSEPLDVNLTGPVVNVSRDGIRRGPGEAAAYGGTTSSVATNSSSTATTAPATWMPVSGSTSACLPQAATTSRLQTKIRPSIPESEGLTPGAYQVHGRALGTNHTLRQQIDQARSPYDQNTDQSRVPPERRVTNIPVSDSHIPPELRSQSNSTVSPVLQASNSEIAGTTTPGQPSDALSTQPSGNNDPNIDTDAKRFNRRHMYWLAGIALVIACIGAVVGIGVSLQRSDSPATLPPALPTVSKGVLVELIQSRSPTTSFVNSTSAQSQALEWMLSDPYTLTLEQDARLVQRFALVTLWYSTHAATGATNDMTASAG